MWFIIVCVAIFFILKSLLDHNRRLKFPPGPRGLPIIGNIFDIVKLVKETKYYSNAWCRLAEKYGPIVGLRLGFDEPLIIVSGKPAITEMLNRSEFDGRPDGFLYKFRTGGTRQGILFSDTDVWHSQRRFTLRTLKQFGFGKHSMEHVLQHDAITLTNIILDLTKSGSITNIQSLISAAVLSNLWLLIDGTKFDVGMESSNIKEAINALKDLNSNSNVSGGIINYFPFLRLLFPNMTGFSNFVEKQKRLTSFFRDIISKHKWNKTEEESSNFIDAYLQEIENQKLNSPTNFFNGNDFVENIFIFNALSTPCLSEEQALAHGHFRVDRRGKKVLLLSPGEPVIYVCTLDIGQSAIERIPRSFNNGFVSGFYQNHFHLFHKNQLIYVVKDLFSAGVDTTDNTIGFVIAFLVVYQDVQVKVHDEIDKAIGRDTYPCFRDKDRLPYLKAVIAEVSRLANVGPTSIPHRAIKDSNLLGYDIKKNYTLLANFKSVHMDKDHWGDPEVFRPERFINEDGQFIEDSWLMPFGLGRRKCLGESLAKNTVFLFLACLLQRLRFMLPPDHPNPCLHGVDGFVVAPPGIEITAVQRY